MGVGWNPKKKMHNRDTYCEVTYSTFYKENDYIVTDYTTTVSKI